MRYPFLIILVVLLTGSQSVQAQSKKKREESKKPETSGLPSSLSPSYSEKSKETTKTKKKKSSGKIKYHSRDKYNDRMEQVAKDNRKAEKELQKPQYSDPSYFGHKKPPKRRPVGKLKYCKECGIRH